MRAVVEGKIGADDVRQRLVERAEVGYVSLVLLVGFWVGAVDDRLERVGWVSRRRVGAGYGLTVDWAGPGQPRDWVVLAGDRLCVDGRVKARYL